MGAVAVLHPHDHFHNNRHHHQSPLPSSETSPKVVYGTPNHHQPRRKRSTKLPLMGQVQILKRGQPLPVSSPSPKQQPTKLPLPLPLPLPPPDKEFVQIRSPVTEASVPFPANWFYAGSAAFVASPPPSSVPLPGFFAKKGRVVPEACDSATTDLRRILRLD